MMERALMHVDLITHVLVAALQPMMTSFSDYYIMYDYMSYIIVVKVTVRSVSLITTGIDSYHRSYTSCFLCGKKQ